jgi:hypothetical protein
MQERGIDGYKKNWAETLAPMGQGTKEREKGGLPREQICAIICWGIPTHFSVQQLSIPC